MHFGWETAPDDARHVPMTPRESGDEAWRWAEGSPSLRHAEGSVNGASVHVDRVGATKYGPGRSFVEFRIFVNGRPAGRGGRCGCSLGGGGSNLPAVALVGANTALTVDDTSDSDAPIIELWELRAETR